MLKSGFKTSEFYVVLASLGGILWTFAQTHCSVTQQDVMSLLIALTGGLYVGARTFLKSQMSGTTVGSVTPPSVPATPAQ